MFEARNEYTDWQEFYLWVRSILEMEDGIPNWLFEVVNLRCPGFLESERALIAKAAKARPLHLRLEDWIGEHVFGFAKVDAKGNTIVPLFSSRRSL